MTSKNSRLTSLKLHNDVKNLWQKQARSHATKTGVHHLKNGVHHIYTFQKCTISTNEKSSIFRLYNNIKYAPYLFFWIIKDVQKRFYPLHNRCKETLLNIFYLACLAVEGLLNKLRDFEKESIRQLRSSLHDLLVLSTFNSNLKYCKSLII